MKNLPYLYEITAEENNIDDLAFLCESKATLRFLQKVNLSKNKIKSLPNIASPAVVKLTLDENEITTCDFKQHPTIKVLSLNKNKLTTCEGLCGLSTLEELNLCEMETLTKLDGLSDMPALKSLKLTGSKIESLQRFPNLPALEELDLTGNGVAAFADLNCLSHLKNLSKLSVGGTPMEEEKGGEFKKEILVAMMDKLPKLKSLNGEEIEEELMKEAIELKEQRRLEEEEKARIAAGGAPADAEAEDA